MDPLFVTAVIQAAPGREAELEKALHGVVGQVRAEPGCIRYDLHRSAEGTSFLFYETWTDETALAAHLATDHMQAMFEAIRDLTDRPGEVRTWRAVDVPG